MAQAQSSSGQQGALLTHMESELQVLSQQARATQQLLARVQQQEATGAPVQWGSPAPLAWDVVVWGGVALLLLATAALWLRQHKPYAAVVDDSPETDISALDISESDSPAAVNPDADKSIDESVMPPVLEGEDPDTWIPEPPQEVFNLDEAIHEVSRVRATLAQRRQERARQREEDARTIQDFTPSEQASLYFPFSVEPSQPASLSAQSGLYSVDLELDMPPELDLELSPSTTAQTPLDTAQSPMDEEPTLQNTEQSALQNIEQNTAQTPLQQAYGIPQDLTEQDYAVTLALAQESEAVDLWDEARELATEVLESADPVLQSQAQAMLDRLDQLANDKAAEQRLWGVSPDV